MMGGESRTGDGRNLDLCGRGGGGVCRGGGLPDAADEAADEGICVAENVSGVRVDHAAGEFGLPGVWEGDGGGAVVLFVASWWAAAFLACVHRLFRGSVSRRECAEFRDCGLLCVWNFSCGLGLVT
jgi:hypothetical protein